MNKTAKNRERQELLALMRLHKAPKINHIKAHQLIHFFGSAFSIFEQASYLELKQFQIGAQLFSKRLLDEAEQELQLAEQFGYTIMGYGCVDYPKHLLECEDAPLILYSSGAINWNSSRWISVVGTRRMSKEGLSNVKNIIKGLQAFKPTIVSGLAYGVDSVAHQTAIDCGLQTIACLAHGLQRTYPKSHYAIRKQMESNGGVISEFSPNEAPLPYKFVQRNRIIAGLSIAVIVIESPERGGSLITADLANSYHREVFALPNRISDRHQGCNHLIRDCKAQLVGSAKDIVEFLGWD